MTEVRRTPVFPSHRDKGRWHVTITVGALARDIRLPNNPLTAEAAEIEAQRLYELNGGTAVKHKIRWYAVVPKDSYNPTGLIPRNKHMNGGHWGWDVKCSCGQESHTGGYIEARMKEKVYWHKAIGERL